MGTYSPGIAEIPDLSALLGVHEPVTNLWTSPHANVDHVVVWGRKPKAAAARFLARMRNRSVVQLEDGFLRSVGLGVTGARPLSIVVDPVGIYYDATRPSRLENLLAGRDPASATLDDPAMLARARELLATIRRTGISKYNGGVDVAGLPPTDRSRVLVVDQTDRDVSLRLGRAMSGGLRRLTCAALDEHRDAEVIVKIHPDVIAGRRTGHEHEIPRDPRVRLVTNWVQPKALLDEVTDVYVMTSQLGFDALLHGHRVHCFGVPFYAGWGLTSDRVPTDRRGMHRSLEALVAAALVVYPRYVDPDTGIACGPERVVDVLARDRAFALADAARESTSRIDRRPTPKLSIREAG